MRIAAAAALALVGACAPLERDEFALPGDGPGELAVVESVERVRVETSDETAADRLIPVFLLAGPIGLAASASHEGDFSTVNGREYRMKMQSGELRVIRGFAIVDPGDCVLLRRDRVGRYLAPMRREAQECATAATVPGRNSDQK